MLQLNAKVSFCKLCQHAGCFVNVDDVFFQPLDGLLNGFAKLPDFILTHDVQADIQVSFCKLLCCLIQLQNRFCQSGSTFADSECDEDNAGCKDNNKRSGHHK